MPGQEPPWTRPETTHLIIAMVASPHLLEGYLRGTGEEFQFGI